LRRWATTINVNMQPQNKSRSVRSIGCLDAGPDADPRKCRRGKYMLCQMPNEAGAGQRASCIELAERIGGMACMGNVVVCEAVEKLWARFGQEAARGECGGRFVVQFFSREDLSLYRWRPRSSVAFGNQWKYCRPLRFSRKLIRQTRRLANFENNPSRDKLLVQMCVVTTENESYLLYSALK
jgi:hypothetical protein